MQICGMENKKLIEKLQKLADKRGILPATLLQQAGFNSRTWARLNAGRCFDATKERIVDVVVKYNK